MSQSTTNLSKLEVKGALRRKVIFESSTVVCSKRLTHPTGVLLSRSQHDRVVLRNGRVIDTTLPDYCELDSLFQKQNL